MVIRAIRADDETLWLELMRDMSWATRYKRGARRVEDLNPEDARRAVSPDPAKEIALEKSDRGGRDGKDEKRDEKGGDGGCEGGECRIVRRRGSGSGSGGPRPQ